MKHFVTNSLVFLRRNIFLSIMAAAVLSCGKGTGYYNIEGYAQGGTYRITLETGFRECAELQKGIERILADIDNSISGYNDSSSLSKFNNNLCENCSDPILLDIFAISERMYEECDGYFDISAGALFDAWGFGFKEGSFPGSSAIDSIKNFTGMDKITLRNGTLHKSDPRVTLNFNAIAQGYTCDLIARYLSSEGIENMLINVGGEIFGKGVNPAGNNWTIGIDAPIDGNMEAGAEIQATVELPPLPTGIVTSGNYRKFYIRDEKKYAHTINPKTGRPVEHNLLSATVICRDATTADALATYMMAAGLDESIRYVESHQDIEAVLIYEEDGKMKTWMSQGVITGRNNS